MKFYSLVILPKNVDITCVDETQAAVAALMKPFEMWQEGDSTERRWDYYWCCIKDGLSEDEIAEHPQALADNPFIVFPVEAIDKEMVVYALVTPDVKWHQNRAACKVEDPDWPDKAIDIMRGFKGHYAVLVYCHG